jgi:hypothetical protein
LLTLRSALSLVTILIIGVLIPYFRMEPYPAASIRLSCLP